jgi:hypothetical protein
LILQRQIEQRRERRKCLDVDIRLSRQKPGVRVCRPVEHPCRDFKPPICLRPIKRAAEDDKTTLVDGTMNANSATKPGMMPIKNLAKNGPVGVLKPRCTTTLERIGHWIKMLRFLVRFSESEASNHTPSLAAFTNTTTELKFSVHTTGGRQRSGQQQQRDWGGP